MTVAETRDYALRRGPVSPRPSLSPPLPWRPENLRPPPRHSAPGQRGKFSLGTSLFVRQGQRGRGTRWATKLSSAPSSSGDCHQVKNITLKIIKIFWFDCIWASKIFLFLVYQLLVFCFPFQEEVMKGLSEDMNEVMFGRRQQRPRKRRKRRSWSAFFYIISRSEF